MKIGIIGAMSEEIKELKSIMKNINEIIIGGLHFFEGDLHGKNVVLVECGIGKVNAAITATLLINFFKISHIIFTGVAGSLNENIDIFDIVIGTELIETDFDVSGDGKALGVIPRMKESFFKPDKKLFDLAIESAINIFGKEKVISGRISTRDEFVTKEERVKFIRETFNAECTEMEGAAVAHTCYIFNIPFVVIRSISDKSNSDSAISFEKFVSIAAKNSKLVVEEILKKI